MFKKKKTVGILNPCAVPLSEINEKGYLINLKCLNCGYTSITRETSLTHPNGDVSFGEYVLDLTCNGPDCQNSRLSGSLEKINEVQSEPNNRTVIERLLESLKAD